MSWVRVGVTAPSRKISPRNFVAVAVATPGANAKAGAARAMAAGCICSVVRTPNRPVMREVKRSCTTMTPALRAVSNTPTNAAMSSARA